MPKDHNGKEIKPGALILYGFGFYRPPIVGLVTRIYKNGVKISYTTRVTRIQGDETKEEIIVAETICKKPYYSLIVDCFRNDPTIMELFHLDMLDDIAHKGEFYDRI